MNYRNSDSLQRYTGFMASCQQESFSEQVENQKVTRASEEVIKDLEKRGFDTKTTPPVHTEHELVGNLFIIDNRARNFDNSPLNEFQ